MKVILPLSVLLSFGGVASAETGFFLKKGKKLCGAQQNLKSFKDACTKKKYRSTRVFKCKNKCKERKGLSCKKRKWEVADAVVCNSDGKKKGIYLTACSGDPLKAKNVMEACALKAAKGQTVVKCKYGKELDRQACSSAKNNDEKGLKIGVFVEECGGRVAKKAKKKGGSNAIWFDLGKACKQSAYRGETLVRCTNRCTKRKGLKCVRRTWKEDKRVVCNDAGKKVTLKDCNAEQAKEISEARTLARSGLRRIILGMKTYLKNPRRYYTTNGDPTSRSQNLKQKDKKWVAKALKVAEKSLNKIKAMPSTYKCDGNAGGCDGNANAHTLGFFFSSVKFCHGYLKMDVERKAAVLVHEISHNFGTDDITYKRSKIKDVEWWKNAETYEWWLEKQVFCIPGYDC